MIVKQKPATEYFRGWWERQFVRDVGEKTRQFQLNKNATDWERPWQKSQIKRPGLAATQRRAQRKYREQAPILI